ncbi:putative C2H2 finger domain protein [Aspergillus foveolatus]|uniref:putative C2H2 finger domain protein n=1 Tax=Aspergillus foveolatus TaxID=210207 RepID=UPI003CCD449A
MGTGLEVQQPLSARRPGAPPLPTFELPAPTFTAAPGKNPAQAHPLPYSLHHPHLPPPNPTVIASQPEPPTTSTAAAATAPTTTAATAVTSSPESTSYWATGSYSGSAGTGRQSWTPNLGSSYSNRDPFSPSFNPSLHRNPATSTPGADPIPSAYDMNQLPPFQQQLGGAATAPGPAAHLAHSHPVINPHPSVPSNDPYMAKSSSAPAYGAILSSPPGYQYPPAAPSGPPPPLAMHHPPRVASNPPPPPPPPTHLSYPHQRQPWPSYSLPAMTGPVMSNVHSPGGQMSLMGPPQSGLLPGFNSGLVASMQQMYGGHPPHAMHGMGVGVGVGVGPTNDRPFKCDKCGQSFNRNHDLKRHSRIHLAVKPYPCHSCDKQFSRKDALKRHQLVKGCKDANEPEKSVKIESGEH